MVKSAAESGDLHVLVVGNNPIDLSHTFERLQKAGGKRISTEIAFDLKSLFDRLVHFTPNFIVLDDNIGQPELKATVSALQTHRKTKHIPITVLKNSNYQEAMNTGVLNYLLKDSVTSESLYTAFKNSLKFKRTQEYLQQAYRKRKGQLLRILNP